MKRFARAVMISLRCLPSFATSASAECAWVLWTRLELISRQTSDPWGVVQALSTREDCIAAMHKVAGGTAKGSTINEDAIGGSFYAITRDRGAMMFGKCLPDTVDPRGPKGK